MLKISRKDKVSNSDVLKTIGEKEPQFEIVRQKLAYTGHVLRESGGRNALVILEGKSKGKKKQKVDQRECGLMTSGSGQC